MIIVFVQRIMERQSQQRMAQLEDETHLARERAHADADFYTAERRGAANKLLLSSEYLELRRIEAIAATNKVYFGDSIPRMFLDPGFMTATSQSPAGAATAATNDEHKRESQR